MKLGSSFSASIPTEVLSLKELLGKCPDSDPVDSYRALRVTLEHSLFILRLVHELVVELEM
jgi:hypothetical protein